MLHARHLIQRETIVGDNAILELHFFIQCTAKSHDDATFYLCLQIPRILNRSTFVGLADGEHLDLALRHFNFGTGSDIGAFFRPAG